MTSITDTGFSKTKLICRQEGDGFLIHVPYSGAYIYATASGRDLVTMLAETPIEKNLVITLADRFGLVPAIAESWAHLVVKLLGGVRPGEADEESVDRRQVGAWLLEEIMGDKGQRCETFGMPF